jgi:hypothetical protein
MTTDGTQLVWVPDACTLPTAQQPLRLAEFDDLFTNALRSATRLDATHLRLHLTGPGTLENTIRDLVARESQCCSFFTFTTTLGEPGMVTLEIQVPAAYADVLNALTTRATTQRARQ